MSGTINGANVSNSFITSLNEIKAKGGKIDAAAITKIRDNETDGVSDEENAILTQIQNSASTINLSIDSDGEGGQPANMVSFSFTRATTTGTSGPTGTTGTSEPTGMTGTSGPTGTTGTSGAVSDELSALRTLDGSNQTFTSIRQLRGKLESIFALTPPPSASQADEIGRLIKHLSRNLSDADVATVIRENDGSGTVKNAVLGALERTGVTSGASQSSSNRENLLGEISTGIRNNPDFTKDGRSFSIGDVRSIMNKMEQNGATPDQVNDFLNEVKNNIGNTRGLEAYMTDVCKEFQVVAKSEIYLSEQRYNPLATTRQLRDAQRSDDRELDRADQAFDISSARNKVSGWNVNLAAGTSVSGSSTVTGGVGTGTAGTETTGTGGAMTTTAGGTSGVGISAGGGSQTATATVSTNREFARNMIMYERLISIDTPASRRAAEVILQGLKNSPLMPQTTQTAPTAPTVTAPTGTTATIPGK